ncbi:hypothetical protein [Brevundimonas naejangsanensis]
MTAPMPETMSPREKVEALKTNDPTNPAHRLAKDLQAGHFAAGEARDDLIEVLSNLPRYAALASSGDHSGDATNMIPGDHAELAAISSAIGTVRFMDPPDGGDVPLSEQVRRMASALTEAERKLAEAVGIVRLLFEAFPKTKPRESDETEPHALRVARTFLSKEAERG